MKVEDKGPRNSSEAESPISNNIQSKKVLNLSGIVKRYSDKEYCFKISCNDIQLIKSLKKHLQTDFSDKFEIKSQRGYYDRRRL